MKTRKYLSSLAVTKSIYGYPFNYIVNALIAVPLIIYLDNIGIPMYLNAIVASVPFVIMALFKNYLFFWLEDRYLVKFEAKKIIRSLLQHIR